MFDWLALFGGIAFVVGNIAITFATITYANHILKNANRNSKRQKDQYELLKNALLSLALSTVYSNAIDNGNYKYDEYDGSMLPPFSGHDLVNSYMSYLVDSENPHIHAKYNAIQRFLHSNILTELDQEEFMAAFIVVLKSMVDEKFINEESAEQETDEPVEETIANKEKEE
jgi:hypothetical protein